MQVLDQFLKLETDDNKQQSFVDDPIKVILNGINEGGKSPDGKQSEMKLFFEGTMNSDVYDEIQRMKSESEAKAQNADQQIQGQQAQGQQTQVQQTQEQQLQQTHVQPIQEKAQQAPQTQQVSDGKELVDAKDAYSKASSTVVSDGKTTDSKGEGKGGNKYERMSLDERFDEYSKYKRGKGISGSSTSNYSGDTQNATYNTQGATQNIAQGNNAQTVGTNKVSSEDSEDDVVDFDEDLLDNLDFFIKKAEEYQIEAESKIADLEFKNSIYEKRLKQLEQMLEEAVAEKMTLSQKLDLLTREYETLKMNQLPQELSSLAQFRQVYKASPNSIATQHRIVSEIVKLGEMITGKRLDQYLEDWLSGASSLQKEPLNTLEKVTERERKTDSKDDFFRNLF